MSGVEREYKGRFRNGVTVFLIINIIAIVAFVFYSLPDRIHWITILTLVALIGSNICIFYQNKTHKVIIDVNNRTIKIKPEKTIRSLNSINSVKILRSKKGDIRYLDIKFDFNEYVRVYPDESYKFLHDLVEFCDKINIVEK